MQKLRLLQGHQKARHEAIKMKKAPIVLIILIVVFIFACKQSVEKGQAGQTMEKAESPKAGTTGEASVDSMENSLAYADSE